MTSESTPVGGTAIEATQLQKPAAEQNSAELAAARASEIVGTQRYIVFVATVEGGKLHSSAVTNDFPEGDLFRAVELFQNCCTALEAKLATEKD